MPEWVNVVIRSTSLIVVIFIIAKLFGKRHLSQLSVFEYLIGLVISVIAATVSIGLITPFWHGIIGLGIWFIIPFLLVLLAIKSKPVRDLVRGKGTVFIKDGKVMEDNLKKEKYSSDDLLQQLRNKNVFQVADVEFAVLEADGDISVLPKKEKQPLTPKDLGITVAPIKEPQTVVMDGEILYEPLATGGFSVKWLETEFEKLGVSVENVYLAQVDSFGQLTVDLFDDKLQVPAPQEKPLLLATTKKMQADMEIFALSTQNKQAKQMYTKNSQKLQKAIDRLTPFLSD
ncbi:DUF421 domain-containing protein [Aquibacillus rhizosphaerae]|uniref:DUF421 domain-containing protein n=1 Tax=Aquibacillus rhizosphaerae TaxID=3051431 RepID=A0ABT7L8J5_9BACI|nr:DUF421 domain-containing protein [Aquibacillus sp. LR5S19]MDL4842183.1 DUF421 domain-containing protein [Aquibacillus sp. LR5S19]